VASVGSTSPSSCPHCGEALPRGARFCPECGRPASSDTVVAPPRKRRWPPDPIVLVVVLVAVGGVILLAGGLWAWGLVVLLVAGVVFLSQREAERRAARYALAGWQARLAASREALAARSRGQLDLFRLRRERAELEAERTRAFTALGRAVFGGDKDGKKAATDVVQGVVDRIEAKEAEIDSLVRRMEERVNRAQAGVRPTEQLPAAEEPSEAGVVPEAPPAEAADSERSPVSQRRGGGDG
jgi:hypothetical protein